MLSVSSHGLSDDLECVNQFQVDTEGHIVVVESFFLRSDVLEGAGILVVMAVHEAHVLALVEFGISSRSAALHAFFETVSVLIHRKDAGVAHRAVLYFGLLHHELQGNVVDRLFVHNSKFYGF